mmetsp:Transcript_18790/g.35797  ORF Transcript_18790/g.35797 Transcript_18790/m.35797 type:complete len:201 (-) Transcript_18790:274-876(-)|eukprot:CAMPEP_0114224668 /NCGR_PEP_ID=MMETSP0058-20121206/236_1 /TAXON_ID=36894 /ORGANISM="Pyramimonas parkeae, CCMP726" /LENGTH=200 /DNA_ID=CAMNT_0001335171 /DNA_START=736 /DNA_END=1338 /DNA_ORIENTATION=+
MFTSHALRRLGECIWVFNFRKAATMHIGGYLLGISYYTFAPLSFLLGARAASSTADPSAMLPRFVLSWWKLAGVAVFAYGSMHQHICHRILGGLRNGPALRNQGTSYHVPRGDWFDSISCAHYTAEVVLYVGLVMAAYPSSPNYSHDSPVLCRSASYLPLAVWLAVVANLGFSASLVHRWYIDNFPEYPKQRNAFIPWVI